MGLPFTLFSFTKAVDFDKYPFEWPVTDMRFEFNTTFYFPICFFCIKRCYKTPFILTTVAFSSNADTVKERQTVKESQK